MADPGRTPSLVILGTDAVLAARPATPVQLAHACAALGHDGVAPMSWGDELVADAALRHLEALEGPAVLAACPCVTRRVLQAGDELHPYLVALVSPPVALARYLRALWAPRPIHVTLVGGCEDLGGDDFDARLAPEALLASFEAAGVALLEQPQVYDGVIPPDRRRHLSLPGGAPSPEVLRARTGRELVELASGDFARELAQALLDDPAVLVDPSPLLACACAGASVEPPSRARAAVAAVEPPRSATPVLVALRTALALEAPPVRVVAHAVAHAVATHEDAPARDAGSDDRRTQAPQASVVGRTTFDRRATGLASLLAASALPDDVPVGAEGRREREPLELPSYLPAPASTGGAPDDLRRAAPAAAAADIAPLVVVAPPEPAPAPTPRPDEMEALRRTVERALEPFIAQAQSAGMIAEPRAAERRAAAAPEVPFDGERAAPPRAPGSRRDSGAAARAQEVAAPIAVAREPGRTDAAAVRRAAAAALVVDVEPPPTLKSIAAASRSAVRGAGVVSSAADGPGVAVRATTRQVGLEPAPRHALARRVARDVGIVLVVAAAATGIVAYAGAAGRILGLLTALAR